MVAWKMELSQGMELGLASEVKCKAQNKRSEYFPL